MNSQRTSQFWLMSALLFLLPASGFGQVKEDVLRHLESQSEIAWENAQKIWNFAEPGYQEVESAKLLKDWLSAEGFHIESGIADIPTAFTATYGKGEPVIAIMGEFDALPGLAQNSVPYQDAPENKYYGHGCGHHLFGVASASAALAVAKSIKTGKINRKRID